MTRIALLCGLTLVFAASVRWSGEAQQRGAQPLFTGTTTPMDGADLSAARRRFDPRARTYWHSHDRGQLLLVEQGRMRLQKRGQPMRELGVGESDYTGANVVHWHGAGPDGPLVQINMGFGGETKWLEAVTDAQYGGR